MPLLAVEKALASLEMPTQTAERLRNSFQQSKDIQSATTSQIKREIAEIDKQTAVLYDDRLVGRITAKQYDEHIVRLENERENLKKRASFLTSSPNTLQRTLSQMIHVCQNARKLFEKAEIDTKNLMLEILLSNIKLKNKKLSFRLNFPCWGAGEIQSVGLRPSKFSIWYRLSKSN